MYRLAGLYIFLSLHAACSQSAIGVSKKEAIPDYRFSASSFYDFRYVPYNARLNGQNGWGPLASDRQTPSLNIDLGNAYLLCAVETQGFGSYDEWTTEYKLRVSMDNDRWHSYHERKQEKVLSHY